jgi:hypothetical protein
MQSLHRTCLQCAGAQRYACLTAAHSKPHLITETLLRFAAFAGLLLLLQVKYAALDVLVAGQVFRALRLWHSSPSLCEVCHYDLASVASSSCSAGGGSSASGYMCSCDKKFKDIRGYLQHCQLSDHKPNWKECSGCGCTRRLPWPSGMAKGKSSSSSGGGNSSSSSSDGSGEELSEC